MTSGLTPLYKRFVDSGPADGEPSGLVRERVIGTDGGDTLVMPPATARIASIHFGLLKSRDVAKLSSTEVRAVHACAHFIWLARLSGDRLSQFDRMA